MDHSAIDPEDAFLLNPLSSALPPTGPNTAPYNTPGVSGAAGSTQAGLGPASQPRTGAADVTWLRRTEYLAMEQAKQRGKEDKGPEKLQIDTSTDAMVERIKATFDKVQKQPLSSLRHPTKPHLRAIRSWEVLPDAETWATNFHIVRFQDWPGRSKNGQAVSDPRIAASVIRPDPPGVEPRLSFYLVTPPDADALTAEAVDAAESEAKLAGGEDEDEELFGSDEEGKPEKKKSASKEALIGAKVEEKHQKAERTITERFLRRRKEGELPPLVEEDGELTIPEEVSR